MLIYNGVVYILDDVKSGWYFFFFILLFVEISIVVVKKEYKDCDGYYEYLVVILKFNLEVWEFVEEWSMFI